MPVILHRKRMGEESGRGIIQHSSTGISMVRNKTREAEKHYDVVFRYGCTSKVDADLIVNSAEAIHWCTDKRASRLAMQEAGVSVPRTWAAEEWLDIYNVHPSQLPDRYIIRPAKHSQGRWMQVGTAEEVSKHADRVSYLAGYVSILIDKVAEFRVAVVCNRVAWVAQKTPGNPEDVAWNVSQGGHFANVAWENWPLPVIKQALAAMKVGNVDFGAVDVMVDAEGVPYVLEINSAPLLTSIYRRQCFAKCFDFVVNNGKYHFPDAEKIKTYKAVAHPAIRPAKQAA